MRNLISPGILLALEKVKMLIQSSLPNSISTALSIASDNGIQPNMDLLCDWSHCGENWQKSPKCDECSWEGCREAISAGEDESKLFTPGIAISSDLSVVNNMCDNFPPKRDGYVYKRRRLQRNYNFSPKTDGYVYKRRRLQRNSVALLPEENAADSTKGSSGFHSSITSIDHPLTLQKGVPHTTPAIFVVGCSGDCLDGGNPSISGQHHLQNPTTTQIVGARNSESVPNSLPSNNGCSVREITLPAEASVNNHLKSASEHYSTIIDSSSSSKSNPGHDSTFVKTEVEDTGECSSSDLIIPELLEKFPSAKELCIFVLKRHGLLGDVSTNTCASLEVQGADTVNLSQPCKICGILENPLKMLICDLCEEVFHVSCCNPKVKKLPIDEWYCQPCFRKKPKPLLETGKSFNIISERRKRIYGNVGPITFMLRDNQPYATGVRIGKEFQAEVPEWSGPILEDNDYFSEPSEMDPAECSSLNVWNCDTTSKLSSIGNWIQCREVIHSDTSNVGTVCRKWRRAPLFVVQTDDWDCSCSVLWDPIHADCAVPQELETDVVLKHLKYIKMLRPQLAINKQRPCQNRIDG